MGRFNRDLYLWMGAELTRPYREWAVMRRAAAMGLRVPSPVAASACRVAAVFYRAAILTPWVDHVGSLAVVSDADAWFHAGSSIAQMHAAGIWHADLNVHNILIDQNQQAWLIDFDRAREGVTDPGTLQGNLSRLKRSVDKVCPDLGQGLWSVLLDGYAHEQKLPR
jgi:3-deoxy-D-manno-octulosonic acid kinase